MTRTRPPQLYARIAGAAYVIVILVGVLHGFLVDSRLVVSASDAETARNLLTHPTLFRIGVAATLVLYALVLVLAWALYEVLEAVEPRLARLGLLFRGAESIVGVSTLLLTLFLLDLADRGSRVADLEPKQLHALVGAVLEARTSGMDLVLVLIGVGGTVFCCLLFTSRLVPRGLAAWGVMTYLSMLALGFLSLLWPDHPTKLEALLYGPGALFELTLGGWLLVQGIDERKWQAIADRRAGESRRG